MKLKSHQTRRLCYAAALITLQIPLALPALAVDCDRDQFSILAIDNNVIASTGSGGSRAFDLDKGEEVLAKASSGCVALVSTNRRLLVISALGGAWTPIPYRQNEQLTSELLVGDLVGMAITDRRIIAFEPVGRHVVKINIPSQETVTHWAVGESVVAAATGHRLIGFSAGLSRSAEIALRLEEHVESFDSASDIITVVTEARILTLRSGSGVWGIRKRPLY